MKKGRGTKNIQKTEENQSYSGNFHNENVIESFLDRFFLDSWTFYVTFQIKYQQTRFKHVGIKAKKDQASCGTFKNTWIVPQADRNNDNM